MSSSGFRIDMGKIGHNGERISSLRQHAGKAALRRVACALLLSALSGVVGATTYKVGTASATCTAPTHATIAAAITAAAGSAATPHTIQICPGTYNEGGLTLNNTRHNGMTITSTSGNRADVTVAAGGSGQAFDINGRSGFTLSHLTITGSNNGVYVRNWANGVTLNGLSISAGDDGIVTDDVSNFSVADSTVVAGDDGIDMGGNAGGVSIDNVAITAGNDSGDSGIEISNVYTSLTITRVTVTQAGSDGIRIDDANSLTPTMRDLNITASRHGLYANNLLLNLGVATLANNTIDAGQRGVYLTGSVGAFQVSDTAISAGTGSTDYHGIYVPSTYGAWGVRRVTITQAGGHGIYVLGGGAPVIEDVVITASQDGINVDDGNGTSIGVAVRTRNSIGAGNRGIYLSGGIGNFSIKDCEIRPGTDSSADHGILTDNAWVDYTIQRNIVYQAGGHGIYLQGGSTSGIVSHNLLASAAGNGLRLGSSALWATATVYNNCFYNGSNAYNYYRSANFQSGTSGNYWGSSPAGSGYSDTCADANANGICDAAYTVPDGFSETARTDAYPRKTCNLLPTPTLSLATPAAVAEGNSGTKTLTFTATLSSAAAGPVAAPYTLTNGTATGGASCATAGVDYINTGGTLNIASGATTGTIAVTLCGETMFELDETFIVTLGTPVNATLGAPSSATGTITNDDSQPIVSIIANASVDEGNSGTTPLPFALTLSNASYLPVTVGYATSDGTATGGASCASNIDYIAATSGSATIAAGSTAGSIVVSVCGDTLAEVNETFTVTLSSPVNASLGNATGTGTIGGDDYDCYLDTFTGSNGATPGADWRTTSSSGSFGQPRIWGNRLRLTDATSSVSTAAHLQKAFPGAGNKIVVEFDLYAYNGSGADGIALTFSDAAVTPQAGAFGGSLGYAQKSNPGSDCTVAGGCVGFAGGWLGIGFDEFGNFANPTEGRIGGPGLREDRVTVRGSGSGMSGYIYHTSSAHLSPGIDQPGTTAGPGYRYRATIDHSDSLHAYMTIERNTGTGYATVIPTYDAKAESGQAAVPANWMLSFTGATGGSTNIHEIDNLSVCAIRPIVALGVDHYVISHSGAGLTCEAEPVTFTAHDASHARIDAGGRVLGISTSTGKGTWLTASDSCSQTCYNTTGTAVACAGSFTGTTGNNGQASYQFANGESGVRLCLRHNDASTISINVSDGTASETSGAASGEASPGADPGLVFGATGFRFYADDTVDAIGNLVAGLRSDIVDATFQPTPQSITIRALKSSETTPPRCVSLLGATTQTVKFAYQCLDPAACHASSGGLEVNGTAVAGSASVPTPASDVAVAFNASGIGAINLKYWDVGQIKLHAQASVADTATGGSAAIVSGASNGFVVKPYGFTVMACTGATPCTTANSAATDGTGSVFAKAGDAFNATIRAVAYGGTVITPSFGLGTGSTTESVNLTTTLVAPAPAPDPANGTPGTLGGTAAPQRSAFTDGSANLSDLNWSEVGVMTLTAASPLFQTVATAATGSSGNIGRFTPHHFGVTGAVLNRSDLAAAGGGFTYMGEPMRLTLAVTAYNKAEGATQNYKSSFAKLDAATLGDVIANWTCTAGAQCMGLAAVSGGNLSGRLGIDIASPNSAAPTNTTTAGGAIVGWSGGTSHFRLNAVFNRAAAPDGPFANLEFGAKPRDSDGVTLPPRLSADAAHCVNLDISSGDENAACDPGTTETNLRRKLFETAARFGRLHLYNAYGSELLVPRVEYRAEFWNGTRWATNTDDSATAIAAANVATGGLVLNNVGALANGVGSLAFAIAGVGSYDIALNLGGTVNDTSCNPNHPASTAAKMPWLQGFWGAPASCGGVAAWAQDPSARVRLGSPKAPFLFMRESY
jgi:MSHA biogenesis protein MshQ